MHDLMGGGNQIHEPPKPKQGLIATLLNMLFGEDEKRNDGTYPQKRLSYLGYQPYIITVVLIAVRFKKVGKTIKIASANILKTLNAYVVIKRSRFKSARALRLVHFLTDFRSLLWKM